MPQAAGKKTAKGFFVLQKDAKKTPKGCRTNFVLQLVGNLFWTLKGRLSKKDGKKSWHSHSAKVNQDSLQVLLLQQQKQRSKTPNSRRNSKLRKKPLKAHGNNSRKKLKTLTKLKPIFRLFQNLAL